MEGSRLLVCVCAKCAATTGYMINDVEDAMKNCKCHSCKAPVTPESTVLMSSIRFCIRWKVQSEEDKDLRRNPWTLVENKSPWEFVTHFEIYGFNRVHRAFCVSKHKILPYVKRNVPVPVWVLKDACARVAKALIDIRENVMDCFPERVEVAHGTIDESNEDELLEDVDEPKKKLSKRQRRTLAKKKAKDALAKTKSGSVAPPSSPEDGDREEDVRLSDENLNAFHSTGESLQHKLDRVSRALEAMIQRSQCD